MHSIEGLERGIEHCKKNITVFETAIEGERTRIDEFRGMIETLKERKRELEALKKLEESINANPNKFLQ